MPAKSKPSKKKRIHRHTHGSKLSDEDIARKTAEVERALAEQRARHSSSLPNPSPASAVAPKIPGMVYDVKTDRYYKRNHFKYQENGDDGRGTKSGSTPVPNIIHILHQRTLYPYSTLSTFSHPACRSIYSTVSSVSDGTRSVVSNVNDIKSHPKWGLAVAASDGLFFNHSHLRDIDASPFPITAVQWGRGAESNNVPILAFIANNFEYAETRCDVAIAKPVGANSSQSARADTWSVLQCREIVRDLMWMPDDSLLLAHDTIVRQCPMYGGSRHCTTVHTDRSEVMSLAEWDGEGADRSFLLGLRSGYVSLGDLRTSPFTPASVLYQMTHCIDHIFALRDTRRVLVRDVTGCITMFDVRVPHKTLLSVCPSQSLSSISRSRFWVCPEESFLLTAGRSAVTTKSSFLPYDPLRRSPQVVCALDLHRADTKIAEIPGPQPSPHYTLSEVTSSLLSPNCSASPCEDIIGQHMSNRGVWDAMLGPYVCVNGSVVLELRTM